VTVFFTVANSEDSVVETGTAARGKNTTVVVAENTAISIDGDSDGLLGNGGLKLRWVVVSNILEAIHANLALGAAGFAFTILTSVFVVRLEHDFVFLGVFESLVLKTTIAATIMGVTVNELLLGKGEELTRF